MIEILEAATSLPVTVDEAKAELRIQTTSENDKIERDIRAAVEYIEQATTLVLAPQTMRMILKDWCPRVVIPLQPVRDVLEVSYIDTDGNEQVVASSEYNWRRTATGAEVAFKGTFTRPYLIDDERDDRVFIKFEAGYDDPDLTGSGADPNLALPHRAVKAILGLVGHWYANREAVQSGPGQPQVVPLHMEAMVQQLRVFR